MVHLISRRDYFTVGSWTCSSMDAVKVTFAIEGDIQDLRFSDVPYGSSILAVLCYRESIVEVADG